MVNNQISDYSLSVFRKIIIVVRTSFKVAPNMEDPTASMKHSVSSLKKILKSHIVDREQLRKKNTDWICELRGGIFF